MTGITTISPIIQARLPSLSCAISDRIPLVSTITNLAILGLKAVSSCYSSSPSYSHTWLNAAEHRNTLRCCLLLIPVLGNIVVYLWDQRELTTSLSREARQWLEETAKHSHSVLDNLYSDFAFIMNDCDENVVAFYGQRLSKELMRKRCDLLMTDLIQWLRQEPNNPQILGALCLVIDEISEERRPYFLSLLQTAGIPSWNDLVTKACALNPREASLHLVKDGLSKLLQTENPQLFDATKSQEFKQSCYVDAVTINPYNPWYWAFLGDLLRKKKLTVEINGDQIGAKECYVKILELNPKLDDIWCRLADGLASLSDSEVAIISGKKMTALDCYIKVLELDPIYDFGWKELGDHLSARPDVSYPLMIGKKQIHHAYDCYIQAIKLDPSYADYWQDLGDCLKDLKNVPYPLVVREKQIHHVYDCYIQAIELDPSDADYWQDLGDCLKDLENVPYPLVVGGKQIHHVYDCYIQAIELDPSCTQYWEEFGTYLYKQIVKHGKSVSFPLLIDGKCINNLQEFYLRALDVYPNSCRLWNLFGIVLERSCKTVLVRDERIEAAHAYAKALELDPKDAILWMNLGRLLKRSPQSVSVQRKQITARACFEKAVELNPSNTTYQQALASMPKPSRMRNFLASIIERRAS